MEVGVCCIFVLDMPIFAVTYGSFGDIAQCVQLLWKIGTELCDATGSSSEYQALKGELVQTVQLLHEIQVLKMGPQTSHETQVYLTRLLEQAADCHRAIVAFLNKRNKPKGFWQTVSWHTLGTSEAKELQGLLARRCAQLTILLQMYNASHQEDRAKYEQARLDGSTQKLCSQIQDMGADVSKDVALVGQQLARFDMEIRERLTVLDNNIKETVKVEPSIILIDPLNQTFPISILYCSSYEMMKKFIFFLATNYGLAGRSFVEDGQFELINSKERRDH
ncbi:SubName: Full=Uncharacterized protein {ECO:0000313/EMBL:CCA74842.1} [Serendipita indica DSM 11827]|nr:SubName: Full=Uncharacterized protein {ECO:0000313/EMBL:CCA74842.1} [Serendipita indica DSM 11827]